MSVKIICDSACDMTRADSLPACIMGSTIGTHAGPGAVAVAFFSKD